MTRDDEQLLAWARELWKRTTDLMLTPPEDDAYNRLDTTFRGGTVSVFIVKRKEQADAIEKWIELNWAMKIVDFDDHGRKPS